MTSHYPVVRYLVWGYVISRKPDVTFDGLWVGYAKASFIVRRWASQRFLSGYPLAYDTCMFKQIQS